MEPSSSFRLTSDNGEILFSSHLKTFDHIMCLDPPRSGLYCYHEAIRKWKNEPSVDDVTYGGALFLQMNPHGNAYANVNFCICKHKSQLNVAEVCVYVCMFIGGYRTDFPEQRATSIAQLLKLTS